MRIAVPILLLVLAVTPGCIAVAAGAAAGYGAVQYKRNSDARDYAGDLPTVWRATLLSLGEQGYPVAPSSPPGATHAALEVNDANVWANVVAPGRVRVVVRIGTFTTAAHRRMATNVHAGIARHVAPVRP